MNEQLMRDAVALFAEEPRRLDMMTWVDILAMGDRHHTAGDVKRLYPACGAVGCLYGWGRLLIEFGSKEALIEALARFNTPLRDGGQETEAPAFEPDEEMEGLYRAVRESGDSRGDAAALFDLSPGESDRLTLVECWPEEFYYPYMMAHYTSNYERKASVLAMRVEYFIQTKGTDEGRSTHFRSALYRERKHSLHSGRPHRASEDELKSFCSFPETKEGA